MEGKSTLNMYSMNKKILRKKTYMIIYLNLNYYSGAELSPYNYTGGRGLVEGRKSVIYLPTGRE